MTVTTHYRKVIRLLCLFSLCITMPLMLTSLEAKNDKTPPGQDKKDDTGDDTGDDTSDDTGDDTSDDTGDDTSDDKSNGNSGNSGNSGNTLGNASGLTTKYYVNGDWSISKDTEIVGPVIIVIDGDWDIGNNTVTIASGGSLKAYVGGDISVKGNGGINNTQIPSKLVVLGTHPYIKDESASPDYSWTLSGNGYLSGVVYAPSAEYRTNGGGNAGATLGSVVAMDIRFNGSPGPFHFDESLADLDLGFGGYSLASYDLLKNGLAIPSTDVTAIVGSQDYDALFSSLFDKER